MYFEVFGKPNRITVQTSLGRAGLINIEREAKLSGKIHDKGVLIIAGYFRGKYAQKSPLTRGKLPFILELLLPIMN